MVFGPIDAMEATLVRKCTAAVLSLMQSRNNRRVDINDPDLVKMLGTRKSLPALGPVAHRIANAVYDMRRDGTNIKAIRDGRTVVAYELLEGSEITPTKTNVTQFPQKSASA